ncbi:hypothetical protein BaRGS_00014133 [Batillaria attramentaria]|uniref:Uncharacterized protein n=1 Tax=Batillaria attramentaria TaxID=370345 RepID=A0ABD0L607_9CAEN
MALNVTFHSLDVSYSCDMCGIEQPQKRFKALRRRSANFLRARQKLAHRNSDLLSCTLSLSQSLAVAEGDIIPGHNKLVTANSVNSILHQTTAPFEESGRVAGWAVGFQRLVADPAGLSIFTEFLKKEFSQENIEFWSAVEGYRQISDEDTRRRKAREIFNNHLGSQASDPVNVDSMARQCAEKYLDNPTPTMFDVAQQQIFHLMRQDSYVRFLKSDLYKGHLMREMEGQPLAESNTDGPAAPAPENKKKGKGKENEEKRRRSILPWRQNKKSSVKTSSDSALKGLGKIKEKDDKKEKEVNNNLKKAPGPGIDLSTMRKEVFNPKEVDKPVANEQFKFCRVVMPDGSTTVVCTRPGQSIRTVLGKLCDKRGISIASVEVFLLGSEKPLDLGEDISTLGSKEVVIERRVLFRLDMPNHKSIGVKAKPNRSIRDVFKPILNKYGYRIDNVGVQLSGMAELLDMDIPVSDIDNQRVIIIVNPDAENATDGSMAPPQAALPPRHRRTPHLFSSRVRGGKGGSLEEITNQIFDDLMKGKSELAHTFDELGVVDLERSKGHKNSDEHRSLGLFGLLRKESWGAKDNTKKKGKVTFALPRSDSKKNKHKAEDDRLMELIEQAETEKLEQQRAMAAEAGDYPEFLCTDAVEHVDMATHDEALLKSIGEYDANSGVEGALLPPPDMFDDVHYMHSGSRDNLHLSGRSQDVTAVTPRSSSRGVTDPRGGGRFTGNTPTPTPRGKHNTQESNVGGRPPSTEDSNTYLAMQPVIVDAREGRSQQQQQARQRLDSNSFSKSVMSRFDELRTFSPTKGDVSEVEQAPVATPEGISPRKTPDVCDVRKADFTSPETGRPVPAKRRAWDDHGTQGQSVNSPVAVSPQPATPRQEPGVAGSRTSSSQRLSGAGGGGDGTRNTPVPSSDQGGRQEVFTPRYTSPPPYSTVTSARSTFTLAKPPLSPSYSAGTPLRSSTSPNPPQTYRPNSARDSPYRHSGGFYTTRESLHDPAFQQYGYKVTPIPSRTASFDLINPARGTDSPKHQVMSPRDGNTPTPRDGGITPRRSPQNDYIGSLSFNKSMEQISPKDKLINHYAAEKANVSLTGYSPGRKLQTPDILSSQYSHSVAGLVSPRQLTPPGVKSGQTIAVAVDVHQPKDHDFSPSSAGYTRPLSQTFDAASFSDQTVTFV